jgi:hypothetical protein
LDGDEEESAEYAEEEEVETEPGSAGHSAGYSEEDSEPAAPPPPVDDVLSEESLVEEPPAALAFDGEGDNAVPAQVAQPVAGAGQAAGAPKVASPGPPIASQIVQVPGGQFDSLGACIAGPSFDTAGPTTTARVQVDEEPDDPEDNEGKTIVTEFGEAIGVLRGLAASAAAHRRKLEFAVSQFAAFIAELQLPAVLTDQQREGDEQLRSRVRELHALLRENQAATWAKRTMEQKVGTVAAHLGDLIGAMHSAACEMDPNAAPVFDANRPEWAQLHMLDLRAIRASFADFLGGLNEEDVTRVAICARLRSIDRWMAEGGDESCVQAGIPADAVVDLSNYTEGEEIASGAFARVFFGTHNRTGEQVAIKRLHARALTGSHLVAPMGKETTPAGFAP